MGEKCFFVDENLKCPHCRKKMGEKALRNADKEFNRDIDRKVREAEKIEESAETIPIKKSRSHKEDLQKIKDKQIDEYLRVRIKNKKGIEAVKELISKKEAIALLDFEDVKTVVDNSKNIHIFSGDENDFESAVL